MNMIVSDYDGTIKRYFNKPNIFEKIDLQKDIDAINKFIDNGHKFVISTKRATSSILEEIEKRKLNFSYLTTFGGLVTIDNNKNIIYADYLKRDIISTINEIEEKTNLIKGIEYIDVEGDIEYYSNNKVLIIVLEVENLKETFEYLKHINDFNDIYMKYKNNKIYIKNHTDKSIAIEKLLGYIPKLDKPNNIVTVGDSFDDMPMIKNYNGYIIRDSEIDNYYRNNVLGESKYYYGNSDDTVSNIRRLIKKIK